jgi:hypothetical protein
VVGYRVVAVSNFLDELGEGGFPVGFAESELGDDLGGNIGKLVVGSG